MITTMLNRGSGTGRLRRGDQRNARPDQNLALTPTVLMKIEHEGNNLRVSDIAELNAVNASSFRDEVRAAMPADPESIEIDLSQTRFVDSSGLGALFALYKAANNNRDGVILRLLNPRPSIQQLFELTQLHQLFEITRR